MPKITKGVYHNGTLVLKENLAKEAEGKTFTVIVLEERKEEAASVENDGRLTRFFALAKNVDIDEAAVKQLREISKL